MFLFVAIFFILTLNAESDIESGYSAMKYEDTFFRLKYINTIVSSEDDTLKASLTIKNIKSSTMNQNNYTLFLRREIDLDKHVSFGHELINGDMSNGDVYIISISKDSKKYQQADLIYSKYEYATNKQIDYLFRDFISDLPVFYSLHVYYIKTETNTFIPFDLKIGGMYSKTQWYLSTIPTKSKFLIDYNYNYNCSYGKTVNYSIKTGLKYYITNKVIFGIDYFMFSIEESRLDVVNMSLKWRIQ